MSQLNPVPINPPPGIVKTEAGKVVAGRYTDCDKIHSSRGKPQKLGGWSVLGSAVTSGTPRACHGWRDNTSTAYFAIGTYRKLYAYDGSWAQTDITPYRTTGTLGASPFATTSGQSSITVTQVGHGLSAGDTVIFSGATAFNGVTLNGTFIVDTVVNSSSYTFTFTSTANATSSGGGASVAYSYEIPVGVELGAYGYGWGVGGWGLDTWGTARSSTAPVPTQYIEPRVWSIDHFGQILLASYNGGSIYTFDPTVSQPWPRAAIIAAAPTDCRAVVITPERYVVALRTGMVVQSSTQNDYTVWTPSATNTAWSRTLTEGTKLVTAKVLQPFVTLVWTDAALYRFQYTGNAFIYDSSLVGRDCGCLSPNVAVTPNGVAYWMGWKDFLMYDGSVHPMPNSHDIRKYVFDNLDPNMAYQSAAVYNPVWNEIYFFYTVNGQTNPTTYVVYSINDQCWWVGSMPRASGTHFTQGDTRPIMCGTDGFVYQHDVGNDANGVAMPYSLTLGPYGDGINNMSIMGFEFDARDQAGNISLNLVAYDRLRDATTVDSQTATIGAADSLIDYHIAGRYIGFTLSSSDLGGYFRMGMPTAYVQDNGTRR